MDTKKKYGRYVCREVNSIEKIGTSSWIFVSVTAQKGHACVWTLVESGKSNRLFAASNNGVVEYNKGVCTPEITPGYIASGTGLPSAKKAQEILEKMIEAERWREITY